MKYVRLKKYEPKRGIVLRQYLYKDYRFRESEGWYIVSEDVANYLRANARQKAGDDRSFEAFDICDEKEARDIDEKEIREAEPRRPADKARVYVNTKEEEKKPSGLRRGRGRRSKPETKPETPAENTSEESTDKAKVEETK